VLEAGVVYVIDLKFKVLLFFEIEIYAESCSEIRIQVVQYHLCLSNQVIVRIARILHVYMDLWVTHSDKI
jgi:cytochrome b subunit of formate dehydrogenase